MRAVVLVSALLLTGCPVEEAPTSPDGGACPVALRFGTELDGGTFTELSEGLEVPIIAGPQGGWHVWVSAQVTGLPQAGAISYSLRSGGAVVAGPLRLQLGDLVLEDLECGWERRSDALVFSGVGENFRGKSGTLEATLESPGKPPLRASSNVQLK